jgi:hypothetical protein
MDQLINRVRAIGRFGLLYGDPGLADALPDRYARVSADAVANAARWLGHDARAVLRLTPPTEAP